MQELTIGHARHLMEDATAAVGSVLYGNLEVVRMAMAAVVGRGHVLIEDVPGVGKTTLARALARVLGCSFSRIQFTADMLPSDVLGVHILDPQKGELRFKRGPLFAQVVLADEINRASPKTQSAMLEAMSDRQVTIDETTFALPELFAVLATQNPVEHHGTYPLPESQLDRFMVRLAIGYPPAADERRLIRAPSEPARTLSDLPSVLDPEQTYAIQTMVEESVMLSEPVADYLLTLVEATRSHPEIMLGCSPRGAMLFAAMARAWAFVHGRDFVLPDDIKRLASPVLAHRLVLGGKGGGQEASALVEGIVSQLAVPR